MDFCSCFDSLVLLLFRNLGDLTLGWENVLVVTIRQTLIIVFPNNTIEEGVIFYLLSAVEAQPGHRVSNHQLRDQVSSLRAHLPWELDWARLNVLI